MNAIRRMMASEIIKAGESKTNLTLVSNEDLGDKKETVKMTKEYLNEMLHFFYEQGGPIMDI